ncbi:hypothetical protein F3I62_18785 [Pseudomonas sp. R-28-1W-6]|uniref:hypothetical protein n=1 Tax=Pseudomonas sp. R-28-1W-6 TaxID=2650101 RepID=UPI0013656FAC|nr:hypothetical protein [Pseudomonas sp. R-28-1W-6]MWV14151.1 hypothetical protein [Pseudomonas sp. R-28-1W-6]
MNTSLNAHGQNQTTIDKWLSGLFFFVSCVIISLFTIAHFKEKGNPGLTAIYVFAMILVEAACWNAVKKISAYYRNKSFVKLVFALALVCGGQLFVVGIHWNFIYTSFSGVVKSDEVEQTTAQENRKEKIDRLVAEYRALEAPIESPDFGIPSIESSIRSVEANAKESVRQGSTTNGHKFSVEIGSLQDKLMSAQKMKNDFILAEQQRRDQRKREIISEVDQTKNEMLASSKAGSTSKMLSEENALYLALFGAILIKLGGLVSTMGSVHESPTRLSDLRSTAKQNPASAEEVRRPLATPSEPPVAAQSPVLAPAAPVVAVEQPEEPLEPLRSVACAAPAARDERMADLVSVEADPVVLQAPGVDAEALAESSLEPAPSNSLTADSIVAEVSSQYRDYYRALLVFMKTYPRDRKIPTKDIPELADVSMANSKMLMIYKHAKSIGLMAQPSGDGGPYFVTDLIDEVVI